MVSTIQLRVCVCVRERDRQRGRERERQTDRGGERETDGLGSFMFCGALTVQKSPAFVYRGSEEALS